MGCCSLLAAAEKMQVIELFLKRIQERQMVSFDAMKRCKSGNELESAWTVATGRGQGSDPIGGDRGKSVIFGQLTYKQAV
jgi:hypothetical protein